MDEWLGDWRVQEVVYQRDRLRAAPVAELVSPTAKNQDCMTVRIVGLGMDEKVNIETEEDLEIVEVLLKKARRLLKTKEAESRRSLP